MCGIPIALSKSVVSLTIAVTKLLQKQLTANVLILKYLY